MARAFFSVEQFMGSFQLWATSYMLKAFVAKKSADEGISMKEAAEQITDSWYQSQLEGFNKELSKLTAGEFRKMQAEHKIGDTEDLRVEFRRTLELANTEVMKMLVDSTTEGGK